MQPGTRSIPLPFDSSRSTARKKVYTQAQTLRVRGHTYTYTSIYIVIHLRVSVRRGKNEEKEKEPAKVCRSIFDYVRQRIRDIKDNYGLYRGNLYFSLGRPRDRPSHLHLLRPHPVLL